MPTETPALARDAEASANPPATSAIKRSFLQFMVFTLQIYLTLFETKSFANLFEFGTAELWVAGNANSLAQPPKRDTVEARRIFVALTPRPGNAITGPPVKIGPK